MKIGEAHSEDSWCFNTPILTNQSTSFLREGLDMVCHEMSWCQALAQISQAQFASCPAYHQKVPHSSVVTLVTSGTGVSLNGYMFANDFG